MIITENEGLNLNSPIVQNMISFWPKEKLDRTKFYYGRSPTVESVGESIYDEQVKEEIDQISYAEMEEQSMKPGYGKSGWICDICRKSYTAIDCNYFCILCGWDICNNCYNKNQNEY